MNSWNERRIEESLAIHYDDAGKIKIKIVIEGDENSELLLESRNIICVIPFSKNFNSTEVVYVEPASDASAFPALKVAYVAAQGQLSKSILRDFAPSYLWDLVFDVKGRSVEDKNSYALEVIISTKSGAHYARDFWQKDVKRALEHLHVVEDFIRVHETVSTETITQLALDRFGPTANEGKPQIILLLSGDGGIADLVNGLLARQRTPQYLKPIVGLLPMGSGNALANSSGLLADETFGLSTAIRGEPKPVPVFKASFSEGARLLVDEGRQEEALQHGNTVHGVVVCSWGLHAALVADSDTAEYRRLGTERFKIAAKENLFPPEGEPHRYCGKVSVLRRDAYSGELVWQPLAEREEHAYVLVTMVSQFEKGFTISPETKPLDGRMMVVHFGPMAGEDIMNIMEGAYDGGRHVFDGAVGYEGIDGLRIEFDGREKDARYRRICVDGKIVAVDEYGTFRLAQIPDGGSGEASRWASKKEHGPVLKGPISRERARSMLLVHQAGSVKIGEVVRYTLTYTPSADRILPSPAHLHVKIKNTSAIPLRAAYLHGPYTLHVSAYPSTFNPNEKIEDPKRLGIPEFEPFLKAGGHWNTKLTVPEHIRVTGHGQAEQRSKGEAPKSATWVIEIASQILFSATATVHFEVLVGRDARSLEVGFAAVAAHGQGGPGQLQEHLAHGQKKSEGRSQPKGVYSKAVKLVVDNTDSLWNKPALPEIESETRRSSVAETRRASARPDAEGNGLPPEQYEDGHKESGDKPKKKKKKIHLVILTHGLQSNVGADMLYMKESIDAAAKEAREAARRKKRREQVKQQPRTDDSKDEASDGSTRRPNESAGRQESSTAPLSGGQDDIDEEADDDDDDEQVIVRGFSGNVIRTERGIQYLGKRLAKHVFRLTHPDQPFLPTKKSISQTLSNSLLGHNAKDNAAANKNKSGGTSERTGRSSSELAYTFTSISFVAHSLGGLIQLYAIAYIQKHSPQFFEQIKPVNFIAMATPFLGLSNENPMYVKFALDFGLVGRTGQDLGLTWRAPTIARHGWTAMIGGLGASGEKNANKDPDPGRKPLLRILLTGPAHQILQRFRNRTVYSNIVNDGVVPLRTSCLLFLDWRGLERVQKARRKNGLIGTMAEWGWAELTGQNSFSQVQGADDATSDNGSTPVSSWDHDAVPQPREGTTNREDSASSVQFEPVAHQFLSQHGTEEGMEQGDASRSEVVKAPEAQPPQQPSFLSNWLSIFRPNSNDSKTVKQQNPSRQAKVFSRGQTLSSDHLPENGPESSQAERSTERPLASRGYSREGVEAFAPPRTTIFESAGDILHPPLPPTSWLINPSSRPRTIFHDRIYHPEDIPPPPTKRPGRLARTFSGDIPRGNGNSRDSGSASIQPNQSGGSGSSVESQGGTVKVEEKIARAYHRDLSWRKVLVRLEPDAHNNMIVRRMFANAYGWPVVKHLCDTHFGYTYSATTRDEAESKQERAEPVKERPNEEGEEVRGQSSTDPPPMPRSESEKKEASDELTDLRNSVDCDSRPATNGISKNSQLHSGGIQRSLHREDSAIWDDKYFEGTDEDDDDDDEAIPRGPFELPRINLSQGSPWNRQRAGEGSKKVEDNEQKGTSDAELSDFLANSPTMIEGHRGLRPTPTRTERSGDTVVGRAHEPGLHKSVEEQLSPEGRRRRRESVSKQVAELSLKGKDALS